MRPSIRNIVAGLAVASWAIPASAAITEITKVFSDVSGLGAEVTWTWDDANPDQLIVTAKNTSTGVPVGFDSADQLLTTISWDFDPPGLGLINIIGGSVRLGDDSVSLAFDLLVTQLSGGDDVSGEYGYGNMNGTGALYNFVSAQAAVATPFGGANLDGPVTIDGPQAGMVPASGPLVPLGGLGAIQYEIIATLDLDGDLSNLDFLDANGTMVEFGSDAAFIPEPATMMLLVLGGLAAVRRRNR